MVKYQIQFKKKYGEDSDRPTWDYLVGDKSNDINNWWEVVAEHPTLKSAINSAKVLIKKYGYDRVRICRATNMVINIDLES